MKTTTKEHKTESDLITEDFYHVTDKTPLRFGHEKLVSFDIHPALESAGEVVVCLSDMLLDEGGDIYGHDFVMSFVSPASARAMATALLNAAAAAESN